MKLSFSHAAFTAVSVVTMALIGAKPAQAITVEAFAPTTINYPGATSTQARGINTPGDVVGTYVCTNTCVNPVSGEVSADGTHGLPAAAGSVHAHRRARSLQSPFPRRIGNQGIVVWHTRRRASRTASCTLMASGLIPSTCPLPSSITSARRGTLWLSGSRPQASWSAASTKTA